MSEPDTYCCPNCTAVWQGTNKIAQECRRLNRELDEMRSKIVQAKDLEELLQWIEEAQEDHPDARIEHVERVQYYIPDAT